MKMRKRKRSWLQWKCKEQMWWNALTHALREIYADEDDGVNYYEDPVTLH